MPRSSVEARELALALAHLDEQERIQDASRAQMVAEQEARREAMSRDELEADVDAYFAEAGHQEPRRDEVGARVAADRRRIIERHRRRRDRRIATHRVLLRAQCAATRLTAGPRVGPRGGAGRPGARRVVATRAGPSGDDGPSDQPDPDSSKPITPEAA